MHCTCRDQTVSHRVYRCVSVELQYLAAGIAGYVEVRYQYRSVGLCGSRDGEALLVGGECCVRDCLLTGD